MTQDNFVCVLTCNTRLDATIAKSVLDANKIQSFISADDKGGASPFPLSPTPTGVKLMVKKEDLGKAKEVLGEK